MIDDELVTIMVFETPEQANAARAALDAEGMECVLENESSVGALWHMAVAFGGIKMRVTQKDATRAKMILGQSNKPETRSKWRCVKCAEVNEANFDLCWSCGGRREECADRAYNPAEQHSVDQVHVADPHRAPPPTTSETHALKPQVFTASEDAEAMATRAWRAAVIGLLLGPIGGVLLLPYSMWLIFRITSLNSELTEVSSRRFYGALLLNVFAAAVLGILGIGLMFWLPE